jgi:hypothetical protein
MSRASHPPKNGSKCFLSRCSASRSVRLHIGSVVHAYELGQVVERDVIGLAAGLWAVRDLIQALIEKAPGDGEPPRVYRSDYECHGIV